MRYLIDNYSCHRIKHIEESWTERKWADTRNHKHFKQLNNIKVIMLKVVHDYDKKLRKASYHSDDEEINIKTVYIEVNHAVFVLLGIKSVGHYFVPKLLFNRQIVINYYLETRIKYIDTAIQFIQNLQLTKKSKIKNNVDPFRFDSSIAYGDSDSHLDDEDDHAYQPRDDVVDSIGDIKERLNQNSLTYLFKEY